jgi:hypothetical protein
MKALTVGAGTSSTSSAARPSFSGTTRPLCPRASTR